ncbi:MAG: secretin N-terminal domain-containing protein [Planctomycetota bacterium]
MPLSNLRPVPTAASCPGPRRSDDAGLRTPRGTGAIASALLVLAQLGLPGALALLPAAPALAQNPPAGGQDPQGQDPVTPRMEVQGDKIVFSMSETAGMDLKEFVKWAQEMTGKRFYFNETELQTSASGPRVSFLGTFTFNKDTFIDEFFGFFQTMLYIKGFALLPRGTGDLELLEIVSLTGQRGRDVSSSARYVPLDRIDEYRSQTGVPILTTVPLQNINSNIAVNSLRPFFAQSGAATGSAGGLTFGTAGNNTSLLLQGFGPQVYDAVQLLRLVDRPVETPDLITQVHRLEEAAPEELEPILTEILDNRQKVRQQALAETGVTQGASGATLQTGQSQMKIVVNPALKALVLSGTAEQVREALELIARLDVPPEPFDGQASVIPLKNVLAEDLQRTLNEFVAEDQRAEQQAQTGTPGAGGGQRRPRPTVIRVHKESNSLLVSASATKYKQIQALIDELDVRQPQVLIECALVELTTGDLDRFGIELGLVDLAENGDFTRGFGFSNFGLSAFQDQDDDGVPDTRLPDFDNPLQGVTGGIISGGDFAVPLLINALSTDDRANILSMPSVLVNNNSPATVSTEEERPTLQSNQATSTTTTSAGAPRNAGITLEISPTISKNNYLRLNINLEVSRFVGAFDPNSATGGGVTLRRTISTQVTMPSGDTMVLGGVIDDQESHNDGGVPFLKDLPLLGFLFRRSESTTAKTNLYFFVTPTILDEDDFDDLWQVSLQRKMEADRYIGTRRLRLIDRKWTSSEGSHARTLEDTGTTVEDLDAMGENEMPFYDRPDRARRRAAAPTGPESPTDPADGR